MYCASSNCVSYAWHFWGGECAIRNEEWCPAETACAGMCVQVFLTPTHLAIAMEYAQGGDLFNYTLGHRPHGRLAEQQARWIFQQLIIGLDYSHRRVSASPFTCVGLAGP